MVSMRRGRISSSVSEESTSVTDYNEDSLQSTASSISTRKKRKLINSKLEVSHCQDLLDKLRNVKGENGNFLTDSFLKLPKKRNSLDYYDVVESPIDLSKIQLKIKNGEYDTFLDFEKDIEQLVNNAKMYHTSSAVEYQDAVAIWTIYEQEKQNIVTKESIKIENNESRPRRSRKRIAILVDDGLSDQISLATSDDSRNTSEINYISHNPLEVFFAAVTTQKTDYDKDIMSTFTFLPSKHIYPQYYDVIKEPLDLRMIAKKIKNGKYSKIDDLEHDFNIMIKNAKTFNEPKSDVYQDAVELQKIVKSKRLLCDQGSKSQKKRMRSKRTPSQITNKFAHMTTPNDSDDGNGEHIDDLEASVSVDEILEISPSDTNRVVQWQLYRSLLGAHFTAGSNPTAAFMKLPSKKLYPDYYLEILEPMSLLMVKAKIKKNLYRDVDEIVRDLNLVFNNAQQFNVEGSIIYKDAMKLQNFVNMKRTEMTNELFQYSQDTQVKKSSRSFSKSRSNTPSTSTPRRTRPPVSAEEIRVKRINNLFQAIYSYQEDNRFFRDIFMNLPSKEQYPNYYQIIKNPIDLTMVRNKIDDNKYQSHLDLVEDLNLMFSNAKDYNEETSQVYRDTMTLEKLLKKKVKNFAVTSGCLFQSSKKKSNANKSLIASSSVTTTPVMHHTPQSRIREIFQTLKDYCDCSGHLLSEPFVKLPSKQDMPEYYDYIKKPIEIQTIQYRINNERYQNVEEFMEDLFLMFDNACKFNEPDSRLYRDALILHRVCLEKASFLSKFDNLSEPPNVQNIVNEIMMATYTDFMNYTDEDGRYLVDSLREIDGELISRIPAGQNPNSRVDSAVENVRLNLDVIKHHLEKRRYRRMDRFQEDVFSYLRYVRIVSSVYSQAFDDSQKLQKYFILARDKHCERGEVLLTPALNYTERYLNQEIEQQIKERKESDCAETFEDDREYMENTKNDGNYRMLDSVTRQDTNFKIGDFVRIQKEPGEIPRIGEICAILVPNLDDIHNEDSNSDGCLIRVNWYYYPQQTIHKSTKRVMDREIFQTSVYETVSLNRVISKCLIMYIKDYLKQISKIYKENNVFVCESSYSVIDNSFRKLKSFIYRNKSISDTFVTREEPIKLSRHYSTFVSELIKFDLTDFTFALENVKESIIQEGNSLSECCISYDQIVSDNGFSIKVGDYVYVDDETSRRQIVRIDQLWKNSIQGVVYFSGPWFINAMNVDHLPTRMFYRNEVFLSSVDGATHLFTSIIGKCVILSFSEYCKYRPTEYPDDDVYACQYKYFVDEKVARKLKKGLKKALLSTKALDDEIYFFKKELIPKKEPSSMLSKCSTEPLRQEFITRIFSASHISPPPYIEEEIKDTSFVTDDSICNISVTSSDNRSNSKKPKKQKMKKGPSGYVLYAGEIRKKLLKDNPEALFGMISKEVGQMWRNIPQADKDVYERRALEIKKTIEKEAAIAKENEIRKNEALKQQSQIQTAPQRIYVTGQSVENQRNLTTPPQSNQQLLTPQSSSLQNNNPVQYFQASNGQVLQFTPSTNVQTNVTAPFPTSATDQPVQFIQPTNQSSQPVIYQISSPPQGHQQIIGNQSQYPSPPQFLMHQNKSSPFQSPQISTSPQIQHMPTNISNMNYNQIGPNVIFSGPTNPQTSTPINVGNNQMLNATSNPVGSVTHAPPHFISISARNSRVLHSDIYQKYIDKLRKNASTLSDWKQQLGFSKDSLLAAHCGNKQSYINRLCQDVAPAFLDSRLLVDKDGKKLNQESIVDCLFQLRDHMLQDAMNIRTRIVGLSEL